MNKRIVSIVCYFFGVLMTFSAFGEGVSSEESSMTCYYPVTCQLIQSTKYSTGGSDKIIHYMELDCINDSGAYVKYIDKITSWASLIGAGRFFTPKKTLFVKWDKDKFQCKK